MAPSKKRKANEAAAAGAAAAGRPPPLPPCRISARIAKRRERQQEQGQAAHVPNLPLPGRGGQGAMQGVVHLADQPAAAGVPKWGPRHEARQGAGAHHLAATSQSHSERAAVMAHLMSPTGTDASGMAGGGSSIACGSGGGGSNIASGTAGGGDITFGMAGGGIACGSGGGGNGITSGMAGGSSNIPSGMAGGGSGIASGMAGGGSSIASGTAGGGIASGMAGGGIASGMAGGGSGITFGMAGGGTSSIAVGMAGGGSSSIPSAPGKTPLAASDSLTHVVTPVATTRGSPRVPPSRPPAAGRSVTITAALPPASLSPRRAPPPTSLPPGLKPAPLAGATATATAAALLQAAAASLASSPLSDRPQPLPGLPITGSYATTAAGSGQINLHPLWGLAQQGTAAAPASQLQRVLEDTLSFLMANIDIGVAPRTLTRTGSMHSFQTEGGRAFFLDDALFHACFPEAFHLLLAMGVVMIGGRRRGPTPPFAPAGTGAESPAPLPAPITTTIPATAIAHGGGPPVIKLAQLEGLVAAMLRRLIWRHAGLQYHPHPNRQYDLEGAPTPELARTLLLQQGAPLAL